MLSDDRQEKTENISRLYRGLILGLIYLSLTLLLTWPTVSHLTTHLPGDGGDDPAIAWNLWWVKFALLNQGQNPLQTDFMFYPIGINLAFYTLTVLNAITALPLTLNFGVVAASNLHMFFTFAVGGYGVYLLTRYVLITTGDQKARIDDRGAFMAAAMAGGFYAFAGSKLFYVALGQFNIASTHWIPFAVLYILRSHDQPGRLKNLLLAGLFLTMQAWAEITYASFLWIFIALYWLFELVTSLWPGRGSDQPARVEMWRSMMSRLWAVILIGVVFAIGISPILAQMLPDLRAEGDFLVEGSGFAGDYSADLFGFIIPTMHHPLLGDLITQTGINGFEKGQHIYLGFTLLGLLLIGLGTGYRYRRIRFWLIAACGFALLAFGPYLTINGYNTHIPGPFAILQKLPFFKGNRYPSRYSVMLILSLSVIAGFALTQINAWFNNKLPYPKKSGLSTSNHPQPDQILGDVPRRQPIKAGFAMFFIAILFLAEHLSLPLPQSGMRVPEPYQLIAAEPGDFAVLDIPFAWRNGFRITGAWTTQFMFGQFYQTAHQKRLLQGNTSRNPEFKFQYFTDAPILNSLLAMETGKPLPPERWAADQAIAGEVLDFFNIKYIVVRPYRHERFDGGGPVDEQAVIPYIEAVLPVEKIHDQPDITIYRVTETAAEEASLSALQTGAMPSEHLVSTDSPLAPLYFGEGWGLLSPGQPIAAQRETVRLLVPLTGDRQQITLRLRLPDFYQASGQSISLELNGWQSAWQQIEQDWHEYKFDVPAGVAQAGLNNLYLHFKQITELPSFQPGQPPLDVTVLSAGNEVGNFGYIFINGHQISPNQRGYNVAIIKPTVEGSSQLRVGNFDTHFQADASVAMAEFIATAPPHSLFAVAAADEVSRNLDEQAVLALGNIGAAGDLRGCFRCSHAFIGHNPPAGVALTREALNPLGTAGVTTGFGLTEPQIAALVEWLKVEALER